jgi:YD repeat-containing protein
MATRQKPKRAVRKKAAAKRPAAARPRTNGNGRSSATISRRQPETLRLRSVTPTYTVNDLQKTIAWYCDGLGFIVSERWEEGGKLDGVMLKAGSCTFGLSQDDFAKGRDRQKGVGFRIYVETVQSVDKLADRIRAYGGKIVTEPTDMPWNARVFTVEDPDGFRISFSQPR